MVGDYLKRWGLYPQKPLEQAYEQGPNSQLSNLPEKACIWREAFIRSAHPIYVKFF